MIDFPLSNILAIDTQHQGILETVAALRDLENDNYTTVGVLNQFGNLVNKIRSHFAVEESIMLKAEYFDYLDHCAAHTSFLDLVEKMLAEAEKDITTAFHSFALIERTIKDHIAVEAILFKSSIHPISLTRQ